MTHERPVVRVGVHAAVLDDHRYGACYGSMTKVFLYMEGMPLTCKSLKSLAFLPFIENPTPPKRMLAAWRSPEAL